ncbi:unnamed protein product, partial [Phaeothamnion confervicola]
ILELVQLPDDVTPADAFHPDIAGTFHACPPDAAVGDLLAEDGTTSPPFAPQPTKAELIAYANAAQWSLVTGGRTTTLGEQDILFATSTDRRNLDGLTLMNGKVSRLGQANPQESVLWQIGPTQFATIAAATSSPRRPMWRIGCSQPSKLCRRSSPRSTPASSPPRRRSTP